MTLVRSPQSSLADHLKRSAGTINRKDSSAAARSKGPGIAPLSFPLEMARLLQSRCPLPPADDSREVAAIVIGRPSETERGDDQSERLQRRSTVQIRWDERGDLKGFQNRPAGMSEAPPAGSEMTRPWPKISRPGAQAAGRFIRPGHARPRQVGVRGAPHAASQFKSVC